MAEELIAFASKSEMLAKSKEFWNPDKTQFWIDSGVPLVIDRREEYFIYDVSGKRLIDVHLNGGTYNLGHRNPEVVQAVTAAMQHFDIGNHHFPSLARTALAEALVETGPGQHHQGRLRQRRRRGDRHRAQDRPAHDPEAQDRLDRQGLPRPHGPGRRDRRRPVRRPVPGRPAGGVPPCAVQRPAAMEQALRGRDVAAVIMETIPATYGFPLPAPGYLESGEAAVRAVRRPLHRRRGADRADAHRRALGDHQARHRARHPRHRQGHLRRACTRSPPCS